MTDDAQHALVKRMALEIAGIGVGQDTNLFLNAVALAVGKIIGAQFAVAMRDTVALNLAMQMRQYAHNNGGMQ